MDKAQLLDYYTKNYLSRREIMYKLPFNINIDSFCTELTRKRKSNSTVLSLYNAFGKPYWFVVTEKMVRASEQLCEEAMLQKEFDPYRSDMTSAMTWEMFFTSFVEGADIDIDEAMNYLSGSDEPSNIQEQLLWNNRQAWCAMMGNLYRPIDEQFVKELVYYLTVDMETVEDYRQTDTHPIVAMHNEQYVVPTAQSLPERMNDLYAFLAEGNIHPLLKAAVSHAFILTTRPFPEGNERLARMISSAILYRCGYDFLKDISVSQKIAKETYKYYKCMAEIIRSENDADLTYFVEYYIDLLSRALTDEKQRKEQRKADQFRETIESEKAMATQPLSQMQTESIPPQDVAPAPAQRHTQPQQPKDDPISDILDGAQPLGELNNNADISINPPTPLPADLSQEVINKIYEMYASPRDKLRRWAMTLIRLINEGNYEFSNRTWSDYTKTCDATSDKDLKELIGMSVIYRTPKSKYWVYHIGKSNAISIELTDKQVEIKKRLLPAFPDGFTMKQAAELLAVNQHSLEYHIRVMLQTGDVIQTTKSIPYRFKIGNINSAA